MNLTWFRAWLLVSWLSITGLVGFVRKVSERKFIARFTVNRNRSFEKALIIHYFRRLEIVARTNCFRTRRDYGGNSILTESVPSIPRFRSDVTPVCIGMVYHQFSPWYSIEFNGHRGLNGCVRMQFRSVRDDLRRWTSYGCNSFGSLLSK